MKGRAAVTRNRFDIFNNVTGVGLASAGHTRWGGTAGVGWEYGFAPNWSFGVEYDHLWMGRDNTSFAVDMITLRVHYRFGGYGAPVTARY